MGIGLYHINKDFNDKDEDCGLKLGMCLRMGHWKLFIILVIQTRLGILDEDNHSKNPII